MYRVRPGRRLVLASASPRRRDLLGRVGIAFTARPVDIDESLGPGESAERAAERLALAKAIAAGRPAEDTALLTADTLVALGGEVLGKPADHSQASQMLRLLSGQEHRVVTGFVLRLQSGIHPGLAETRVRFRRLSDAEIDAYLASGEPMGKAGAYAIQGQGAALVEAVSGSYTNVVGLPLAAVVKMLLDNGVIEPWEERQP